MIMRGLGDLFFGIMEENILKHVICDSGSFLWLSFPEINDPDADVEIWLVSIERKEFLLKIGT